MPLPSPEAPRAAVDPAETSRQLARVGGALYRTALLAVNLGGGPKLLDRMMSPDLGDVVMEVSRFRREPDPDAIGVLLRVEPGDRWVIEPLHRPGDEQGWSNAQFVALPANQGRFVS